jgi:hypothetical protein
MTQWLLVLAIVSAALVCPAMMWLGRRGIGPGCAICPPHRDEESFEALQAEQRALSVRIEELEARERASTAGQLRD